MKQYDEYLLSQPASQPKEGEEDLEPIEYKMTLPDQQQWQEMDRDEKDGYRTDEWLAWRERQKKKNPLSSSDWNRLLNASHNANLRLIEENKALKSQLSGYGSVVEALREIAKAIDSMDNTYVFSEDFRKKTERLFELSDKAKAALTSVTEKNK